MDNKLPLVTTFTGVHYTNPKYVIEAIDSIYTQSYKNIEHIIVNDAPDDKECWPVIKQYIIDNKLPSIIIEHKVNKGVCNTMNELLAMANGKYFYGCSDDIALPHKLETEITLLESLGPEYAATYSDAYLIDENSEMLNGRFIQKYRSFTNLPDGYIFNELLVGNFLPSMAMLWKTDYIKEIGGYDTNLRFEDYDLHLRLFKKYKIKLINTPTAKYRIHTNSLSNTIKNWNYDYYLIYKKHRENNLVKSIINKSIRNTLINHTSIDELKKYNFKCPVFWHILKILRVNKKLLNKIIIRLQLYNFKFEKYVIITAMYLRFYYE